MVAVCFGGPCTVMLFCYVNIMRTHRHSSVRVAVMPKDTRRRSSSLTRREKKSPETVISEWRRQRALRRRQEELRLTMSLLVVVCVFIVCWCPFCVTMFMWVHNQSPPRIASMVTLLLGCFNSALNPIIYGLMNRKFREGYLRLFLCHQCRHRVQDSSSNDESVDKTLSPQTGGSPVSSLFQIPADEVAV